jgi:HK97 family phage major capsid protein
VASKHERDLKAVKKVRAEKAQEIQDLWDLEAKEDRQLEQDERDQIHELTKALKELESQQEEIQANIALEKQVKEASQGFGGEPDPVQVDAKVTNEPPRIKSMGEQFVESKAYQKFFGPGGDSPTGDWNTGSVELDTKATMTSGGTISGYGPTTQFVSGVVQIPDQQLTVADLLPSNTATSPQIQFFRESLATNNAAGVAEAAGKPESVLDFTPESNSLTKIATYLPVTDEMLEDAPAIQNYINSRLTMFIRQEEEQQILRGVGTSSNEVEGFIDNFALNRVGSATVTGTAVANAGTAVYGDLLRVMNNQRGSSQLDPTAWVMHPSSFGTLLDRFDTNGQYYGGGPLSPGLYGGGRNAGSNRLSQGGVTLWTVPIYVTTQVGVGTALLGNFSQGAALWRKGGISVSASNSHSDFFKKNLTAIRAEERVALTVYRPEAFTVIKWR